MKVLKEEYSNMHQAKKIMKKRSEQKDLSYEQKICLEYLEKIPMLPPENADKLKQGLKKVKILRDKYIALIMNILPDTPSEVEALFSKELTKLKKTEINQIVDIVKKCKK